MNENRASTSSVSRPPQPAGHEDNSVGAEMISEELLAAIDEYLLLALDLHWILMDSDMTQDIGGFDSVGEKLVFVSRSGVDMQVHAYDGLPRLVALSVSILLHVKVSQPAKHTDRAQYQVLILVSDEEETKDLFQTVLKHLRDMVNYRGIKADVLSADSRAMIHMATPTHAIDLTRAKTEV